MPVSYTHLTSEWNHPILFSLFDLNGTLVYKKTIVDRVIELDQSSLIPGMYLFKYTTPEHIEVFSKLLINF